MEILFILMAIGPLIWLIYERLFKPWNFIDGKKFNFLGLNKHGQTEEEYIAEYEQKKQIENHKRGVTSTHFFKCKRCGKCCIDVPLSVKELNMFKYILKISNRESIDDRVEKYERNGMPYKLRGTCPFLKDDKSCEIYSFKPYICNVFPTTSNCIGYRQDNSKS